MKKALVITSVASMVDQFLIPGILLLQKMGFEVHVACNFIQGSTCSAEQIEKLKKNLCESGIHYFHIDFARSVTKISEHLSAYRQVKKIIDEHNYALIHCHSPIGGMIARLACRKIRKNGTTVAYTAHGFHFYKGAPLKNWLLYYPVEKFCSYFTDKLITINHEDYELAQKKLRAKKTYYVPGVGIDLPKFQNDCTDRNVTREELGVPKDALLLLSVGEVNENKNHQIVIRALAKLSRSDVHYAIAGIGGHRERLLALAKELGVDDRVHLLGFRTDIPALNRAADIFCFPSIREGLGLAAVEAMACKTPVVAADNRGTRSFITNGENGFLCKHNDVDAFAEAISRLSNDQELRDAFVKRGTEIVQKYSVNSVTDMLLAVYEDPI